MLHLRSGARRRQMRFFSSPRPRMGNEGPIMNQPAHCAETRHDPTSAIKFSAHLKPLATSQSPDLFGWGNIIVLMLSGRASQRSIPLGEMQCCSNLWWRVTRHLLGPGRGRCGRACRCSRMHRPPRVSEQASRSGEFRFAGVCERTPLSAQTRPQGNRSPPLMLCGKTTRWS